MKTASPTLFALLLTGLSLPLASAGDAPPGPFESAAEPSPQNAVDEVVFARWKALGIRPARLSSDAAFLRRVHLDVLGTLPTAEEARLFLKDPAPDKRARLIDSVLAREEFADYWAMKWGELLRVKAEFPINLWPNAAVAYYRWIWSSIRENVRYDRFARELLTASGSNFRVSQVNFYRALQSREPPAIARAVALTFMGARAEKWDAERQLGMAVFFSQVGYKRTQEWKEEIVFFDAARAAAAAASVASSTAIFPDGTRVRLSPNRDPREVFADWLVRPENPWFSRSIVNRVWSWLLGRGIVHEPDDIRPDNPPANPELLALLEKELVGSGYDLKHIFRLILTSHTYQLSPIPRTEHPEAEAQFASYVPRRLEAEVLIDALCQVTGTGEKYSSLIPEPFTIVPEGCRSIALPDGSITSAFLEMFGRPPRDTGLESERNNQPTAAQRLHTLNSSHIRQKIEQSQKLRDLARATRGDPRRTVDQLYLTVLSRFPTDGERETVQSYAKTMPGRMPEAFVDLTWALINSAEFHYKH